MNYLNEYTQHYQGNHVFVPMGDDFNYINAEMHFKSIDRLITYFNSKVSGYKLIYSTPG